MIYPIVKYGDPVLEKPGETVTEFGTPELNKFLDDMFESMYAAKGVGLAAPQIGFSRRIAVIDTSAGEDPSLKLVLINPEILSADGEQVSEEGCLSIPGFREQVKRPRHVTIRAQKANGEVFEQTGETVDPHTAVALAVADRDTPDSKIPNIVLSTAHAAKFPDAVEAACGVRPELPAWLEGLMTRPEHITVMKNDQSEVERFVRSVSRAAKQGVAG